MLIVRKITVIILLISFILFSGCFKRDERLLMNCADRQFDEGWKKKFGENSSTMRELYEDNLDKRFQYESYVSIYRNCEYELKTSPKTFRQIYK